MEAEDYEQIVDTAPVFWRGDLYGKNPLALKILILGESHYGPEGISELNDTKNVVQNRIDHLRHSKFFGTIEHIMIGKKCRIFEVGRFWHSVAFANYAPRQVIEGNSVKALHFVGARPRFAEMVQHLEPDLVCFFSVEAWNNRPRATECSWFDAFGSNPIEPSSDRSIYPRNDGNTLAAKFNHPRRLRKTVAEWHVEFAAAMTDATRMKFGSPTT